MASVHLPDERQAERPESSGDPTPISIKDESKEEVQNEENTEKDEEESYDPERPMSDAPPRFEVASVMLCM